jgi:hypothetical protein
MESGEETPNPPSEEGRDRKSRVKSRVGIRTRL